MYRITNEVSISDVEPAYVQWNHIDGPLLYTSYASLYWLSLWDRIKLKLKLTTIQQLSDKIDGKKYSHRHMYYFNRH